MKRNWSPPELEQEWSLTNEEQEKLKTKKPTQRLGLAVLTGYFKLEGRFPTRHRDVPTVVIRHVAQQLGVHPALFTGYALDGRTAEADRAAIRRSLGWRPATDEDGELLVRWFRAEILPEETAFNRLVDLAIGWFRDRRVEPLSEKSLERCIRTATHAYETEIFATIAGRISTSSRRSLDRLLETGETDDASQTEVVTGAALNLNDLRADPARPGLESVFREVAKLQRIDSIDLPADVFVGQSPKTITLFRRRAATEPATKLRSRVEAVRYTLVAAFCWERRREIIDGLIDLLIQIIHRIGVNAERKVERELLNDFRRVRGKMSIFAKMVHLSVERPEGVIKEVIYPAVGSDTLKALLAEFKSSGPAYRSVVHTIMRASYSAHYRRMLPLILDALKFQSNNDGHKPVIQALELLRSCRDAHFQYYPDGTVVPIEGVVSAKWREIVIDQDKDGQDRINRINYEICVLQSLREGLRSKEIWVVGADRFRNPDEDVPADFAAKREIYYAALKLPRDSAPFIKKIREAMAEGLKTLNAGIPKNPGVKILERGRSGHHISITPLEAQEEPKNLEALKSEVARRWSSTSLLDILKEAELRVGFTDAFQTTASSEKLNRETVQRRLLLCLYGLGTNTGLKRVLNGDAAESYSELLYTRRRFIQKASLRAAIAKVVNATLAARQPEIWGEGTTACASDSKKFGAWDQNLMTEWHIRYGGRGVMIYWHVERKSVCIYSQLKRCSSSEVAAMIEGVLRHCTEMNVEKNYVDSHGQSEVAFAFSYLLGFDLLPRLKGINTQVLYVPNNGDAKRYPNLGPVLTRPINWELITQQYDEMVKFATALRLGTAESEAILRRFTRTGIQHPTYAALAELGKAVKTIFLCRYLHSMELRREIHEGLNVIENWNSANSFIFFGKGGEVATNQLEDQELSVLSLHLLQLCLVYVNTLMLQRVLSEKPWIERMGKTEFRALSPLIYNHINPYGRFELDMESRLQIDG